MWSIERAARGAGVTVAVLVAGCASNSAPSGFLPSPEEAQASAYGAWIELQLQDPSRERAAEGELLAVTADTVWVLSRAGAVSLPTRAVAQGKLTAWQSGTGAVAGWTGVGVVSTISNGLFLVFTAPLWMITGTVAGSSESHVPQRKVPPFGWAELAAFARFPQGIPPKLALNTLQLEF